MPESFEGLEGVIKATYERLVGEGALMPQPDTAPPSVPLDLEAAKKAGKVLRCLNEPACGVAMQQACPSWGRHIFHARLLPRLFNTCMGMLSFASRRLELLCLQGYLPRYAVRTCESSCRRLCTGILGRAA